MNCDPDISPAALRQLLDYDPETGVLTWKTRSVKWFKSARDCAAWNTRWAGKSALGATAHGQSYRRGQIFNKLYYAHRVAWALAYGCWPDTVIDHINHDTTDNRIHNLRLVSQRENCSNQTLNASNTSGVCGVHWSASRGKWVAQIGVDRRIIPLGRFAAKREAVAARKSAEAKFGFHENHGRSAVE